MIDPRGRTGNANTTPDWSTRPSVRVCALALAALVVVSSGVAASIGTVEARQAGDPIVLVQGGECYPLQSFGNGTRTVGEFYDYRNPYNMNESDPRYSSGYKYSSFGTEELQRNETSQLFLYNGSDGVSLVFVHGKVYGNATEDVGGGGTVAMNISGLPREGYWAVEDDTYPGQRQLDVGSTRTRAVWTSKGGRTDGGAFVGLGIPSWRRIEITPRFNERSPAYPSSEWKGSPEENEYTTWIARSANETTANETTYELDMSTPVSLERGPCDERTASGANATSTASIASTERIEPATPALRRDATADPAHNEQVAALPGTIDRPPRPPHPITRIDDLGSVLRDGCGDGPNTVRESASSIAEDPCGDGREVIGDSSDLTP